MAYTPTFSGKDASIRLFINGQEVVLLAKTWEIGPNTTEVSDGVNGEQRDRLQSITNYFEGNISCFQSDTKALAALIANEQNDDAEVPPFVKTLGFNFKILDGTRQNFIGRETVLGAWKVNQSGRSERVMLAIPIRCRWFIPVPTV
jgi:hypothetical protein